MERFYRTICGALWWLMLLGSLGNGVYAMCDGLIDVLPAKELYNADFTNITLDYPIEKDYSLGSIPGKKLNKQGNALAEDHEITLPPGEIKEKKHKLKEALIVQAKNGQKYLLRSGTEFTYNLPAMTSGYQVTIPQGTAVAKKAGKTPQEDVYVLSEGITAKIKPPANFVVTLTVDAQSKVDRIPGTSGSGTTLSIEPKRAPASKYITLVVENSAFDFSQARFYVCLREQTKEQMETTQSINRFLSSNDVELKKLESDNHIATLRARIPDMTGLGGVHRARPIDLVVVARSENGKTAEAVSKEFLVSSRSLAILCWIAAFVIPWVVAGFIVARKNGTPKGTGEKETEEKKPSTWSRLDPIRFVSGKYGGASLSLAQILLWTVLVFSASFYVLVASGKLLDLTTEVLTLLGIAGGSSVLAKIAASAKDNKGRKIIEMQQSQQQREPKWTDLFQSEGRPDLYKFQMALFTTLAAVFVAGKIFTTLTFPELPANLLTLIGISNGVYLAAKGTAKTVFERLAEKHDELKKAEEEANKRKEERDGAESLLDVAKKAKGAVDTTGNQAEKEAAQKRVEEADKKKQEAEAAKTAAENKLKELQDAFNKLKDEAMKATD